MSPSLLHTILSNTNDVPKLWQQCFRCLVVEQLLMWMGSMRVMIGHASVAVVDVVDILSWSTQRGNGVRSRGCWMRDKQQNNIQLDVDIRMHQNNVGAAIRRLHPSAEYIKKILAGQVNRVNFSHMLPDSAAPACSTEWLDKTISNSKVCTGHMTHEFLKHQSEGWILNCTPRTPFSKAAPNVPCS